MHSLKYTVNIDVLALYDSHFRHLNVAPISLINFDLNMDQYQILQVHLISFSSVAFYGDSILWDVITAIVGLKIIQYLFLGVFYSHGLNLIPAWISNQMQSKVWDRIIYALCNLQMLHCWSFDNGQVTSSHTLHWMQLLIHAEVKVNPCLLKETLLLLCDSSWLNFRD